MKKALTNYRKFIKKSMTLQMKRPGIYSATSTEGLKEDSHRPRRSCRQHVNALIEEQVLEEIEDRKDLLDQRTVRLKEKNKRAQQRFRERQKEKSQQAVVQVQRLQQQVSELKARASLADDRCQLLEKLVALKDNGATTQVTAHGYLLKQEQKIFSPYEGFAALPEKDFIMELRGCSPASPAHITKEQVAKMGLREHISCWKGYVEKMTVALQDAVSGLQSPAARHLQGLTNELAAWCMWVNKLDPHVMPQLRTVNMDPTSLVGPPDPQFLLTVLKREGLSRQQMQQMVAARRFCLATLAKLMRERLSMEQTLKAVIGGGSSWNNMYDSHPAMVDMQQRLAHNVEAESHAFHTFMTSALRRVLNPIQTAALLVESFPYMPNIMAVVACLSSEESGEGSDDDLLELDPVPFQESPVTSINLIPADSLGPSLDALWNDIFLS